MYATSCAEKGKTSEPPGDLEVDRSDDTFTKKPESLLWKIPGIDYSSHDSLSQKSDNTIRNVWFFSALP